MKWDFPTPRFSKLLIVGFFLFPFRLAFRRGLAQRQGEIRSRGKQRIEVKQADFGEPCQSERAKGEPIVELEWLLFAVLSLCDADHVEPTIDWAVLTLVEQIEEGAKLATDRCQGACLAHS